MELNIILMGLLLIHEQPIESQRSHVATRHYNPALRFAKMQWLDALDNKKTPE